MAVDWDAAVIGPLTSVFGVGEPGNPRPIAYTSAQDGSMFAMNGVFDQSHIEVEAPDGMPISSVSPILGVQLSSYPLGIQPQQNDTLVIGRVTFVVSDVQQDGHGWALLMLNAQKYAP